MRSTFHLLEVSKRGLFAQQSALNVTGHNIANANTDGYTRQRANMVTTHAIPGPGFNADRAPGLLGTGVQVSDLQRIREDFYDVQFRGEYQDFGYWEAMRSTYMKIEDVLNEPSDTGLQKVMDQMWSAWQDLIKEPDSMSARAVVRERSISLVGTFSELSKKLNRLQADLDNVVRTNVMDINSIASQIAQLNDQIAKVTPHGYTPNDLYDQRDLLLDKLSQMIDVKTSVENNGMVNVQIQGQDLVTGRTVNQLEVTYNETTKLNDITLGGAPFTPTTGSLAGIYQSRGEATVNDDGTVTYSGVVPDIVNRLNQLAVTLVKEINDVHSAGMNLNDIARRKEDPNAELDGLPFFVDANDPTKEPSDFGSIMVNPAIIASLNLIAAASSEFEGDGGNAQAIADLKFKLFDIGGSATERSTLDDFYRYTVAQLGINSQEALRMEQNSELLLITIDTQRQSVSGVSLDEEMSQMIRFQHAYNASARMMTSMDEILDKIINGMGRVGL